MASTVPQIEPEHETVVYESRESTMIECAYRTSLVGSCAVIALLASTQAWAQPKIPPKPAETPPPATNPLTVAETEVAPLDVPKDQLLQVTGSLALRVRSLDSSVSELEAMLSRVGGRLRHREDGRASFEVPRDRFSEAMQLVAALGVELNRSVDVRDRTPEYLETLALLRSSQETRNRIGGLHRGISGVKDPLRVESELSQWDAKIAELKRRLQTVQRRTAFAIIDVDMQPTLGVVTEEVPGFRLPFPWLDDIGPGRLMNFDKREPDDGDADEDGGIKSDAEMGFHLKVHRATDEALYGGNETAMSAGISMRGVGDTTPIGFAAGMDLELGGGFSGGFLYEYRMLAGVGTAIDEFLVLGIVSGFGLSGLTGDHVPFGIDIPVEAFAAVELGDLMRVGTWGRSSWILASDDRQDGSDTALFGDEFASGVTLLLGEQHGYGDHERTGLAVQGAYRELMGTTAYEVSLGYGISFMELEQSY